MKIKIIQNWALQKIIWTKYFEVYVEFIFLLTLYWKKYYIKIPKWFITDLWSIPSIFFFFNKSGYITYILHDFLYSLIWEIINEDWEVEYTQEMADEILIAWLETEGMGEKWRWLILCWLSCCWKYKYKKRNEEISELKILAI